MEIIGIVGFAGVVVFGLLYIVFLFKGASLKIPVIGMAVFVLVLAASVILPRMGITLPGSQTADDPAESASAGGESSEPASASALISEEPTLTSAIKPEFTPEPASESSEPEPAAASAPASMSVEEFKRILTGDWSNAYRGFWDTDEDAIFVSSFHFSAAGEAGIGDIFYVNEHTPVYAEAAKENGYGWGGDEYGWFTAPMGHPSFDGSYSLTALGNNRFTLEIDGSLSIYPDDFSDQLTYELVYVNDNTIRIDGATYVRGGSYTLAELARIFGFDIEA